MEDAAVRIVKKVTRTSFDILCGVVSSVSAAASNAVSSITDNLANRIANQVAHQIATRNSRSMRERQLTLNKNSESQLCVVCMSDEPENAKCIVTSPCLHLCMCMSCSKRVRSCPLCRVNIGHRLRVYQ